MKLILNIRDYKIVRLGRISGVIIDIEDALIEDVLDQIDISDLQIYIEEKLENNKA